MAAKDQPNTLPTGMDMSDVPATFARDQFDEVLSIKQQANDKFREADYFTAKCLYSSALEMLERCCLHVKEADATWEGIKNNMALCDLKRQEWTRVVESTTEILARNPDNTKALYRRGSARAGQGRLLDAQQDLKAVLEREPRNADAQQKLADVTQQLRLQRAGEREQAQKMRGFLSGERIDTAVSISGDCSIRKVHCNDSAPLLPAWLKRSWLVPGIGIVGVVTAHVVVKTQAGKELFTTRKPPGSLCQSQCGEAGAPPATVPHPAEPARWVVDDACGGVFQAWNTAAKSLQHGELGRFEIESHTLGPSVESTIQKCIDRWLSDTPTRAEIFAGIPDDIKLHAVRRQAMHILSLPEELCNGAVGNPTTSLTMEMELLGADEYMDLDGDGRRLLRVINVGHGCAEQQQTKVIELSTVAAHFRIAKLLMNYCLGSTRMGLANSPDGFVMREDTSRQPRRFVVCEEDACTDEDYVPPCIGRCLSIPPGGIRPGMQFEVILVDGVPVSEMQRTLNDPKADGLMDTMPDTTGPVSIRIEVESVTAPEAGPASNSWQGSASLEKERLRAEELERLEDGRHQLKALRRWRRIICWLEQMFDERTKEEHVIANSSAQDAAKPSAYNVRWSTATETNAGLDKSRGEQHLQEQDGPVCTEASRPSFETRRGLPSLLHAEDDLLRRLSPLQVQQWATAHCAVARILAKSAEIDDRVLADKHARCVLQAASVLGGLPSGLEIDARSTLGALLFRAGNAGGALEILEIARALDPTNLAVRDLIASAMQKRDEQKHAESKDRLRHLKAELGAGLAASDLVVLLPVLTDIYDLDFSWDAANEIAIGKEVGKCVKHEDPAVAEKAQRIVAKLHKLAKELRPLWVR